MRRHYDLSHLPPANFEFVVIADTHYMIDPGDGPVEFESRRKQTARIEHAFTLIDSLEPEFAIHMGDLTQAYPGSPDYDRGRAEALEQLSRFQFKRHQVAGNQDVGDKPDRTMPTDAVEPETLAAYHKAFGCSWYSLDRAGFRIFVINSQILNSSLPEEAEQRAWLEKELDASKSLRKLLFFHLPPYLLDEREHAMGHYDNIAEPARGWLLELVRRHQFEVMATGHVHFQYFNRIGPTRFHTLGSPSFTRPGFGYLFNSGAPPEQGRDDTGKLGFYLFRVMPDGTDVHFLRTAGETGFSGEEEREARRLVTRISKRLPDSPLGLTLRHPLATVVEVPIAFPSTIRQRIRNDHPFLNAVELGVRRVRVPWTDLSSGDQWGRLGELCEEGVALSVFLPDEAIGELPGLISKYGSAVESWEVQFAGVSVPPPEALAGLREVRDAHTAVIAACAIIPGERAKGKQHARTRVGYLIEELKPLNAALEASGVAIDRAFCRVDAVSPPWEVIRDGGDAGAFDRIGACDFLVELPSLNDCVNSRRAAEALFAAALHPGARVYFDPYIDIDRTMDISNGLLDTLCNPRPPFHALRCLNTILFGRAEVCDWSGSEFADGDSRILTLASRGETLSLAIPGESGFDVVRISSFLKELTDNNGTLRLYRLESGTVEDGPVENLLRDLAASGSRESVVMHICLEN